LVIWKAARPISLPIYWAGIGRYGGTPPREVQP